MFPQPVSVVVELEIMMRIVATKKRSKRASEAEALGGLSSA